MRMNTAKYGGGTASSFADYLSEQADQVAAYYVDGAPKEGIIFPRLLGKAVTHLGLERGLTMEQFEDLHQGRWEGEQLVKPSYRPVYETDAEGRIVRDSKGTKVRAYDDAGKMLTTPWRWSWVDVTFSAQKSVIEYMVGATPQMRADIIRVFDEACDTALKAMEDRAYNVRQTKNGVSNENTRQQGSSAERVQGAQLLIVPATQLSARPTEETLRRGGPPDPHLHRHNAISTLAFLPDPTHPDGMRPLTLDEYGIKKMAEEVNAIADAELARGLEDLGIAIDYQKWEDTRKGVIQWEVAGIDKKIVRFHSTNQKRANVIAKEWEEKFGLPPTHSELNNALKYSRVKKGKDAVSEEADSKGVWDLWRSQLEAAGMKVHQMIPVVSRRRMLVSRQTELRNRLMGPKGLCRDDSDFTIEEMNNAIARASVGLGFDTEYLSQFAEKLKKELVVSRAANDERFQYFTTAKMLDKEKRIERGRHYLARNEVNPIEPFHIAAAITKEKFPLDEEQQRAVAAACNGRWVHINGVAGSGKSTAMRAARVALQKAGEVDTVVVAAFSAVTAQRAGIKIGADRYGSIESIERMFQKGTLKPSDRNLYFIDEAAMLNTDGLDRLMAVTRGRGRFVLVGDDAQLSPIGPGGWYDESVRQHGSVELTRTHRFKDDRDVRDYALLRTGNLRDATESIENLAMRHRVHIAEDKSERMTKVIDDYREMRDGDATITADDIRIVVETSNHEVDLANRFVQADRRARGEITSESIEVNDENQNRTWNLHQKDSVIFLRSYMASPTDKPVRNGTVGLITKIDQKHNTVTVRLEDGRKVAVRLQEYETNQPLGLAYSQHAMKMQGGEVRIVQVMPGTSHTADAKSAYSQLTRGMNEAHVYLDKEVHGDEPIKSLAQSWSKRVDKRTALSRVRETKEAVGYRPRTEAKRQAEEAKARGEMQQSAAKRGPLRQDRDLVNAQTEGRNFDRGLESPFRHIRPPRKDRERESGIEL